MKKSFLFTNEQVDSIYDFIVIAKEVAETEEERNKLETLLEDINNQTDYSIPTVKNNLTIQTAAAFERIDEALTGKTSDDFNDLLEMLKELTKKASKISIIKSELNHE